MTTLFVSVVVCLVVGAAIRDTEIKGTYRQYTQVIGTYVLLLKGLETKLKKIEEVINENS